MYRLFVAAIIGFWLLMGSLLVRAVWFRDSSPPVPVPPAFVGHLVFRHELASDLVLYRQHHQSDGTFHIQPKRLATGNLLSANGSFALGLPGTAAQRVAFHGLLELDLNDQVRRVDLSISIREPKSNDQGTSLHVDGRLAENRWHYQLTQAGATLREGSGTPAELLATLQTGFAGLDPAVLAQAVTKSGTPTLTAHRGRLHVNGDDFDTYVVTVRQGDNLETTLHVNQVGQIVAVRTFLGFDLYDETLSP